MTDPRQGLSFNIRLGIFEYAQGSFTKALNHFIQATKIDPNSKDAWYNAGIVYRTLGNAGDNPEKSSAYYDRASKCFDSALQIDPTFKEAWFEAGQLLLIAGYYDKEALSESDYFKVA